MPRTVRDRPQPPRLPPDGGQRVRAARPVLPPPEGRPGRDGEPGPGLEPAGGEARTLPREGEALHLPVHDGRPQPPRYVRPQAAPEHARRPAPAPELRQDPQPVPRVRPALPGESPEVRQIWPVG